MGRMARRVQGLDWRALNLLVGSTKEEGRARLFAPATGRQ